MRSGALPAAIRGGRSGPLGLRTQDPHASGGSSKKVVTGFTSVGDGEPWSAEYAETPHPSAGGWPSTIRISLAGRTIELTENAVAQVAQDADAADPQPALASLADVLHKLAVRLAQKPGKHREGLVVNDWSIAIDTSQRPWSVTRAERGSGK
jgi:hypothetical protein